MKIARQAKDLNGVPVFQYRFGETYNLDGTETNASFTATKDTIVRAVSQGNTYIKINATADTDSIFFPDGIVEYFLLEKDDILQVHNGKLQITECY